MTIQSVFLAVAIGFGSGWLSAAAIARIERRFRRREQVKDQPEDNGYIPAIEDDEFRRHG